MNDYKIDCYGISFYPGEDNERLPAWEVVAWGPMNENGARIGHKVFRTYDLSNGEAMCHAWLQKNNIPTGMVDNGLQ